MNRSPDGELLPCPFAHYPEQLRLNSGSPQIQHEADSYWVSCPVCEVSTISFLRPKSAEHAWNFRSQPNQPADMKRLAREAAEQVVLQFRELRFRNTGQVAAFIESVLTGLQNNTEKS
jgi:hypothetical protein